MFDHIDDNERTLFRELRWWTRDEVLTEGVTTTIFPEAFASLLDEAIATGRGDGPVTGKPAASRR